MKRLLRRTAAAVLMAVCVMSLSACSANQEAEAGGPTIQTEGEAVTNPQMVQYIEDQAYSFLYLSEDQIAVQRGRYEAMGYTDVVAILDALHEAKVEHGTIKGVKAAEAKIVALADGTYTFTMPVIYGEGEMLYVVNMNAQTGEIKLEFAAAPSSDANQTVTQQLESGGVYAGIGIGTVFGVLVFISLLISCFKFIHKWESGKSEKKDTPAASAPAAPAPAAAPAPVAAPAPAAAADGDLMDDTELLLLITTAIAAYEGTSSNGLKVRSIRRAQGAKWKRS